MLLSPVTLPDGRTLTAHQLYLEALRCNSCNSLAYRNLGICLSANTTVTLHDNRKLNERELFREALRCDSTNATAYENLAACLSADETVALHGCTLNNR